MSTKGGGGVIYTNDTKVERGIPMETPFTLKVGQVFTGFGIGCGVGIGVGRPVNLGAISVLSEVMIAARGATDAFSGVHRHVNNSLRKVGAKHIEAGIGCGVGFGHGFGVGLAVKPAVLCQMQSKFSQLAAQLMEKLGIGSNSTMSIEQNNLPSHENPGGSISTLVKTLSNSAFNGNTRDEKTVVPSEGILAAKTSALKTQHRSRAENVVKGILHDPLLKVERGSLYEQAGALQLENNVLQMLLKHQILIEQLMQENEKIRQILADELKTKPHEFEPNFTSLSKSSCADCFECRRKQRKK